MKNLQPQTGPGQKSFFSFFLSFWLSLHSSLFLSFILSSSCFLTFQVSFFYHFFNHMFISFFSFVYHVLIIFSYFFIIFASSGAKKIQEMENYNFPRVFFSFFIFLSCFFHFFHCFIIFHHFLSFCINSTTGSKNDGKKNA